MATYYTDRTNADDTIPARSGLGLIVQKATITIGTALATNDIIQLFKVPSGAIIHDLTVSSNGTQSGNSDAVFSVGIGGDTDKFITTAAGLKLRSGGGVVSIDNEDGHAYTFTADDTIDLLVTTGGTGQTTGGIINATVAYSLEA